MSQSSTMKAAAVAAVMALGITLAGCGQNSDKPSSTDQSQMQPSAPDQGSSMDNGDGEDSMSSGDATDGQEDNGGSMQQDQGMQPQSTTPDNSDSGDTNTQSQ